MTVKMSVLSGHINEKLSYGASNFSIESCSIKHQLLVNPLYFFASSTNFVTLFVLDIFFFYSFKFFTEAEQMKAGGVKTIVLSCLNPDNLLGPAAVR